MNQRLRPLKNASGFTLLEIAMVLLIIGILAGGGISMMRVTTESKARKATVEYLQQARTALLSYAANNGRLPWADTDGDGLENSGNSGNTVGSTLPYATLQLPPSDAYKRILRYEINANLGSNRSTTCSALQSGLSIRPIMVDGDGATTAFSVAAVLVSAGPMDADSNGSAFDILTTGTHQGNNINGTPNYLRNPPVATFDDLTTYIGGNEMSAQVCQFVSISVNNDPASVTVRLYDYNRAGYINPQIAPGGSNSFTLLSGTRIEIHDLSGTKVLSNPPTPITVAGQGVMLIVPP